MTHVYRAVDLQLGECNGAWQRMAHILYIVAPTTVLFPMLPLKAGHYTIFPIGIALSWLVPMKLHLKTYSYKPYKDCPVKELKKTF